MANFNNEKLGIHDETMIQLDDELMVYEKI
jgi:hypothetical protein